MGLLSKIKKGASVLSGAVGGGVSSVLSTGADIANKVSKAPNPVKIMTNTVNAATYNDLTDLAKGGGPQINTDILSKFPTEPIPTYGGGGTNPDFTQPIQTNQSFSQNQTPLVEQGLNPDGVITRQSAVYDTPPVEMAGVNPDAVVRYSSPPVNTEADLPPAKDAIIEQQRLRTERDNMLNTQKSLRDAHAGAVREGYPPGSAQYEQIMRNARTASSNENITATNKFNEFALQREKEMKSEDRKDDQINRSLIPSDVGRAKYQENISNGMSPVDAYLDIMTNGKLSSNDLKDPTKLENVYEELLATAKITDPDGDHAAIASKNLKTLQDLMLRPTNKAGDDLAFDDEAGKAYIEANKAGNFNSMTTRELQAALTDNKTALNDLNAPKYTTQTFHELNGGSFNTLKEFEASGLTADPETGSVIIFEGRPMRITQVSSKKREAGLWDEVSTFGGAKDHNKLTIKGVYLDGSSTTPKEIWTSGYVSI